MIISKTPLRISFFGGSTDNPAFIKKFKKSIVINFSCNLHTYTMLFRDKFGFNSVNNEFIINYSQREQTANISKLKNSLVREVLKFHKLPPLSIYLTSDLFSSGSGLASSSSYLLSLLKAIYQFKGIKKNKIDLAQEALNIERKFNPFCGYQDTFGCAIPGLKIIKTTNEQDFKIKKLNSDIFKNYKFYLLPTNISRNSNQILFDLSKKIDDINPIYEIALEAEKSILKNNLNEFFDLLKISWDLKKKSSHLIMKDEKLIELDSLLEKNKSIIAHKLLGAGAGGFFLIVTKKRYKLSLRNKKLLEVNIDG